MKNLPWGEYGYFLELHIVILHFEQQNIAGVGKNDLLNIHVSIISVDSTLDFDFNLFPFECFKVKCQLSFLRVLDQIE